MNPYHIKLAAAEEILQAVSWEQMTKALEHWPLFFPFICPAQNAGDVSEAYETLRQRAFEHIVNHRFAEIESHLGMGREDQ